MFPVEKFQSLHTPFYYYDIALLRNTLETVVTESGKYPNYHVHYAIKANHDPKLLSLIASHGLGADCVSGGEIIDAVQAGIPCHNIVYAGVGKSDAEIALALEHEIGCFNVESLAELRVINEIAEQMNRQARIAFRVNPDVDAHTHEKITTGLSENKFGISPAHLSQAVEEAQQSSAVTLIGLHFHIGSQIEQMHVFQTLCERINTIVSELADQGITLQSINVGGGLGVDYRHPLDNPLPDFAKYFHTFHSHLRLPQGVEIHFELGRSIICQCGHLISRVLYVKEGEAKKFVILDAGMNDLIRPAMYGARHHITHLTASHDAATETYDIVGPICESSDIFAIAQQFPHTQRGDLLAIHSAGAYGQSMASCYNSRPPAPAVYSEV